MKTLSRLVALAVLTAGCVRDPIPEPESAPTGLEAEPEAPGPLVEARGAGHLLLLRQLGAVEILHPSSARGHWELEIRDDAGQEVWTARASEAGQPATVDWSGLEEGVVVVVLQTLDANTQRTTSWLEQRVSLAPGVPPRIEGRLLIEPENATSARLVELLEEARSGAARAGSKDERRAEAGDRQVLSALLHLRDIGLGDPEAALAAFAEMDWADGAYAEVVGDCRREVELARELGATVSAPR